MHLYFPLMVYIPWTIVNGIIQFVLFAKTIEEEKYETLFVYCKELPAVKKWMLKHNLYEKAPLCYLVGHFLFFMTFHLLAIALFYSFWLSTIMMFYWLYIACWNGACYYMDYHSKRYEKQME